MNSSTRTYVKELVVPALPGVTELYAFRAKRAVLDDIVYSLGSLLDRNRGKMLIEQPLHQTCTFMSGLGAGAITGLCSLGLCNTVVYLAYMNQYEDASIAGAFLIAGR